jgi:3-hydroxyacyl-[acyl-carrier-protein] dehydratase
MDDMAPKLETADISAIMSYLPHRYPFLLIDRIIEMHDDVSCIGIKNVSYNEPQFMGHFPARPLFPGVLIIEGMAQTAGALVVAAKLAHRTKPPQVYFMTIDKAKFRKPVQPGDTVEYHMTKLNNRRNIWWYRGEAKVAGTLVAEAEISAMVVVE